MLKKLSLSLALTFALQVWAGPMTVIENPTELDRYMQSSDFNGVVYVAKNKSTLLKKAFGVKDFNSRIPLTTEDKFQIGSVSKQFVAASLLKLQEEGKLSLDDELTKFFPEQIKLKNIKVRNILNHTAGLKNYTDQEEFWKMTENNRLLTLEEISEYIFSLPFDFEVGSKWNYSNSGYILAGMIVEKLTGETWDQFIKRNFLSPLEMTNTGYNLHFEEVSDVVGHMQDEDGKQVPILGFSLSWALSAGALYSTLEDLAKWTQIYDESHLLNSESKKQMQTAFLGDYGLGVWIKNYNGQTLITHSGRTPGFVTKLHYVKESKLNVVTFNNTDGNGPDLSDILLDFYTLGKAVSLKTKLFPMSEETMSQYAGNFSQDGFSVKVYLEGGRLFLFPDGQKPFLMKPVDVDSFNLEGFAGEEFLRDSEGKVFALKHYQNGRSSIFKKVSEKASLLPLTTLLPKKKHPIQKPTQFRDF